MKLILFAALLVLATLSGAAPAYAADEPGVNALFIDRQSVTSVVLNIQYQPDYLNREDVPAGVLYGLRGLARITIPWSKIARIDFVDGMDDFNAVVTLKDKKRIHIRVEAKTTEYSGENSFGGTFQIRTEHIRSIIFE